MAGVPSPRREFVLCWRAVWLQPSGRQRCSPGCSGMELMHLSRCLLAKPWEPPAQASAGCMRNLPMRALLTLNGKPSAEVAPLCDPHKCIWLLCHRTRGERMHTYSRKSLPPGVTLQHSLPVKLKTVPAAEEKSF